MNGFVCSNKLEAQRWSSPGDSISEIDEKMDCTAFSDCHHHNTVNSNEWERDGLVVDPHRSLSPGVNGCDKLSEWKGGLYQRLESRACK
uniref:Uncharacterized protein n=1 Tax=Hyaloperonospora arabidopsidis (strain Emoy2) TaxID=559515 RepID=M4BGW2_HYAAE